MVNNNALVMRCVHGMSKEHVVSGRGSMCIGPFTWEMTLSEANSVNAYYLDYSKSSTRGDK